MTGGPEVAAGERVGGAVLVRYAVVVELTLVNVQLASLALCPTRTVQYSVWSAFQRSVGRDSSVQYLQCCHLPARSADASEGRRAPRGRLTRAAVAAGAGTARVAEQLLERTRHDS